MQKPRVRSVVRGRSDKGLLTARLCICANSRPVESYHDALPRCNAVRPRLLQTCETGLIDEAGFFMPKEWAIGEAAWIPKSTGLSPIPHTN
jgi:hypothetical protein